jgi:HK97 family phage portal protein
VNIFGLTITRPKNTQTLSSVDSNRGWFPVIRDWFPGAWQRNMELRPENVITHGVVFSCITLISSDIAKLWISLVEKDENGIWTETESSAFSPVLRRPNHYQNRIQFIMQWILSKLIHGNAYVLKERDRRGVVTGLYLLDPQRVRPLVAPNGDVYYQLDRDDLSGLPEGLEAIPAREIIHDIMYAPYHPLVGISPISACGLAAMQGLRIQHQSSKLFANNSMLSGILTAPGIISEETAKRLEEHWAANYAGEQAAGKVAVLGDGLKFEPMTMTARDAQLIDQLNWTGVNVCGCFHVPGWKVGIAPMPAYGNVQAANIDYYSQALQILIESLELCLDEGLELENVTDRTLGVELDVDALLRMDSLTATEVEAKSIGAGFKTPNESRKRFDLKPVEGGDSCFLQQQNYSLAALNKRDQMGPPLATPQPALPPAAERPALPAANDLSMEDLAIRAMELLELELTAA